MRRVAASTHLRSLAVAQVLNSARASANIIVPCHALSPSISYSPRQQQPCEPVHRCLTQMAVKWVACGKFGDRRCREGGACTNAKCGFAHPADWICLQAKPPPEVGYTGKVSRMKMMDTAEANTMLSAVAKQEVPWIATGKFRERRCREGGNSPWLWLLPSWARARAAAGARASRRHCSAGSTRSPSARSRALATEPLAAEVPKAEPTFHRELARRGFA